MYINKVTKNFALITLFLIGILLRFYKIGPFVTFLGDQGRDAFIVKQILTFEHWPAIGAPSSIGQIYLGPFYYYLVAPFLLLFNFNPVGLAYGVAILTIIFMMFTHAVVKKKFGLTISLLLLALITFSHNLVDLSRFSWNPNLLPFFVFFTLYFFSRILEKNKSVDSFLFGAFLSFSVQLHYLALFTIVPIFIVSVVEIIKRKKVNIIFPSIIYAFFGFVLFTSPLILFDLRHNFINIKNLLALFFENKVFSDISYSSRLVDTFSYFSKHAFFEFFSTNISIIFISITLILGFIRIKLNYSSFLLLNLLNVLCFLFLFALLSSLRHPHYYGSIYISAYFVLATLPSMIQTKKYQYAISLILITLFILANVGHYNFLFNKPGNQIESAKKISESFHSRIIKTPIQIVPIPTTETDGHYRYFLDLAGYKILPNDSSEQAEELFVVCPTVNCDPLSDPQWQIAAFKNKVLDQSWTKDNVKIYKLIHGDTK